MSDFKKVFLTILKEQRGLFALLTLNFILSCVLFVISIFSIRSDIVSVKIGYGDIGGYRDGVWTDVLVFPLMSILLGTVHSFIAVRIFERHGDGVAKVFSCISFFLLVGLYIVFFRLINEG